MAGLLTPLGMLIMRNLAGLSPESNCPGKCCCLPEHVQGAAHAPSDNSVIAQTSHGRKQAVQPCVTLPPSECAESLQHPGPLPVV